MRRKQLLAGLAVIAVAALAGACGPAAAHGHSSSTAQSLKPAATDASPQSVLQGVLSSLNSSSIQNASFGVPADGAPQDGNWLYVEISADGTGPATMPGYFDSLVLIGAYDVAAQQQGVSVATGSEVYTAAASGCSTPQDESCNSLEAGADVIAPSVYTPTSNDASALDGQIRDGLAKAGFDAISISFMKPLDSLIPVVVARTASPTDYQSEGWQRVRDEVFGPDRHYEAYYLEIDDQSGNAVAITAVERKGAVARVRPMISAI